MKKILCAVTILAASEAFSGGSTGGFPGLALEQMQEIMKDASLIESLRKEYVSPEVYKRTLMRLSPEGVQTVPMMLRGQYIDVAKVNDRIIDTSVTSEIISE